MLLKKSISILLCFVIVFASVSCCFAASTNIDNSTANTCFSKDLPPLESFSNTEIIFVDDGEGQLIPIEITEYTAYNVGNTFVDTADASLLEYSPSTKVGTKKTISVKVSNNALGAPSVASGVLLSEKAKDQLAKIVGKAVSEKIGANFVPGLNFVVWALATTAFANAIFGNQGFNISVSLVYTSNYIEKEGYYIYGWEPRSLTIKTY